MSGLYIHLPFCRRKCLYCGFMSLDVYDEALIGRYFDALLADLAHTGKTAFDTMYIGGGTPSAVPAGLLDKFLESLFRSVSIAGEFTVEANPESLSADFLKAIKTHGTNRLSMGCQSTDDDVLRLLGRLHDRRAVFSAYDLTRKHLPDADINLDLIFDIPQAPPEAARRSMEEICALKPEHISAYSYSFDTGYLSEKGEVTDSMFLEVKYFLGSRGYAKYEISNFSQKGHESGHNINYWELGDFTGIGASAWSLQNHPDKRIHRGKTKDVNIYLAEPSSYDEISVTEQADLVKEAVVFGLRMTEGVDITALSAFYNLRDFELEEKISRLCGEGLLEWKKGKIALTEKGELLGDSVSEFLW
ncbi:radical SAM family heme chaperone HemW [Geovibrio thiophilus]|uniref:Heme chaperone HemW n=1 Tax=Geovibrio thiophilus TaxID=139438 RepID=A0A410JVF7_9BACT|nr:radical SAM family heme chaperone HemW [Geovibrio thiophilus]QAR32153.1 radical SAM family heme chaperone HemW [Geovibrio thiophilus]